MNKYLVINLLNTVYDNIAKGVGNAVKTVENWVCNVFSSIVFMKKSIYICTTDDKKQRIFYNLETGIFYSNSKAPTPTKYILIFSSIIGFVLLKSLDRYKLNQDQSYVFYLSIFLGIFLGFIISFFIRRKNSTLITLDLNKQNKKEYILLGEKQLDMQKGILVFVFFLAFANTCIFFLDNSFVTMLVLTFVYFSMIIFINYMDILKRKKIYQLIKKEME